MIESIMVLKIEVSSLQRALVIRCTIFLYHYTEHGTLELDDEILEFLHLNFCALLTPNIQENKMAGKKIECPSCKFTFYKHVFCC